MLIKLDTQMASKSSSKPTSYMLHAWASADVTDDYYHQFRGVPTSAAHAANGCSSERRPSNPMHKDVSDSSSKIASGHSSSTLSKT